MRKFISAVAAFAVTAGMFAGMTAVQAEDVTTISTADELQSALSNGGNYKIADNITELDCSNKSLQIKASVTVDLNSAKITTNTDGFNLQNFAITCEIKNGTVTTSGNYAFKLLGNLASNITISNVKVEKAKQSIVINNAKHIVIVKNSELNGGVSKGGQISISDEASCTAENVTITSTAGSGIKVAGDSKVTAKNLTVTAQGNAVSSAETTDNSTIDIIGGTYKGTNYGIYWPSQGNLSIKDAKISSDTNGKGTIHMNSTRATLTIENSTIENTYTPASKAYFIADNSENTSTINLKSGTYTGSFGIHSASNAKVTITGGTFQNADPKKYVDTEKYDVTKTEPYIVTAKQPAAPTVEETDYGRENVSDDGYKTKVFKVDAAADGTKTKLKISAPKSKEQEQTVNLGAEYTGGNYVFAVVLFGATGSVFDDTITAEFVD